MRHAVLGGGKRLRPLVVLATAHALGADTSRALPAASAVELVHCYSLVHDDLPSMDDDVLRRGRPTVHVAYGEALAVLAGDALQSLAFERLFDSELPPGTVRQQGLVLARAAGASGMAGGQALDLAASRGATTAAELRRMQELKTGALLAASFELGALAAGAPPGEVARLGDAGRKAGLAFQIRDDVLDRTGATERLGKTAGKDDRQMKATWPALVGLDGATRLAEELAAEVLALLADLGPRAEPLRWLVQRLIERPA
ncbi:MAG: polyprenyl synthetase family protein [Acidobacteria bacterium]|nr:MAG: polyprenyl synthetase family protein [Acidobacteriota bacterium]